MTRPVRAYTRLENARRDTYRRRDCIVVDVHGLLWSVPTELTVHDMTAQIVATLRDGDCDVFDLPVHRPHLVTR